MSATKSTRGAQGRGGRPPRALPTPREQWVAEMDGINRFLNRLPEHARVHGNKWAERMAVYYRARLKHLKNNPPV